MELIDNFKEDVWMKVDPEHLTGFKSYTLGQKPKQLGQGRFQYAAKQLTTEGDIPHLLVSLEGGSGKANPLRAVINCELIVKDEQIVGINVDGDCVVRKGFENEK